MTETVKVKYRFQTPAVLRGQMEIPKAMFDRLPDELEWSDEIEKYIIDNHDCLTMPPEIDPESDADFDDVQRIGGA